MVLNGLISHALTATILCELLLLAYSLGILIGLTSHEKAMSGVTTSVGDSGICLTQTTWDTRLDVAFVYIFLFIIIHSSWKKFQCPSCAIFLNYMILLFSIKNENNMTDLNLRVCSRSLDLNWYRINEKELQLFHFRVPGTPLSNLCIWRYQWFLIYFSILHFC